MSCCSIFLPGGLHPINIIKSFAIDPVLSGKVRIKPPNKKVANEDEHQVNKAVPLKSHQLKINSYGI